MLRLGQDVRLALRGFRRAPTLFVSAALVLALGIGMATAMAAVYDAVLRRPLPVRDQDRVVAPRAFDKGGVELALWPDELEQLAHETRTLRDVAGWAHWGARDLPLRLDDHALVMRRVEVTGAFFDALGARPVLGRLLRREDDVKGSARILVLSYGAWQRHFGGDPDVVGRQLMEPYENVRYTVVGVAPPGLDYPAGTEAWTPLAPLGRALCTVVARLAPGATPAAVRAEFLPFYRRIDVKHPSPSAAVRAEAPALADVVTGEARPMLAALTAAVTLLLVIACVNVGNLLLLRATGRARELALRRALGGGAGAVIRPLVVESVLLGLAGGTLGLAVGWASLRALVVAAPAKLPRLDVVALDGAPAAVAAGVTFGAVLLFGVVPALVAARGAPALLLRHDARSGSETTSRRRVRHALVAVQVALALVMLVGAGLLARSLRQLERQPLGYIPGRLAVLTLAIPLAERPPKLTARGVPVKYDALAAQILPRLADVPGIVAATPVVVPPFVGTNTFIARLAPVEAPDPEAVAVFAPFEVGGPDYFRTLGTPLRRGRGFRDTDDENAPGVAVISESLARRFWGDADPIGHRMRYPGDTSAGITVIGVAADVRLRSLREPAMVIYQPWRQSYWQGLFAVRTDRDLSLVLPGIRRLLHDVDPGIDLWKAQTMDDYLAEPLAQPRLSTLLLSAFGLVALLLAAIGLYGVMASAVREQTREIGVRMTLGATPARVRGDVLRRALRVAGLGAAAGLAAALAASRLLVSQLYEIGPADPVALAGACLLLLAVALVAAFVPARSATRVDPARALRAD